jgi:hypothetical protein
MVGIKVKDVCAVFCKQAGEKQDGRKTANMVSVLGFKGLPEDVFRFSAAKVR